MEEKKCIYNYQSMGMPALCTGCNICKNKDDEVKNEAKKEEVKVVEIEKNEGQQEQPKVIYVERQEKRETATEIIGCIAKWIIFIFVGIPIIGYILLGLLATIGISVISWWGH